MSLSKMRQAGGHYAPPAEPAAEPETYVYEVFTQLKRGEPHVHAGALHASDDQMALLLAREHYGRDQPCVHVWAVRRDHLLATDYDKDLCFRLTDQDYRFARGYQDVRKLWEKFRKKPEIDQYQDQDIKEHF